MGCDIHAILEVKIDNVWHSFKEVKIERDYELFSKMTDGHDLGSQEPISKAKGLPYDVGIFAKKYLKDCHSISWLDSDEIDLLDIWLYQNKNNIHASSRFYISHIIIEWSDNNDYYGFQDYRLVFGFNS